MKLEPGVPMQDKEPTSDITKLTPAVPSRTNANTTSDEEAAQTSGTTAKKPGDVKDSEALVKQGSRYLVVGFFTAGIELVLFWVLASLLGMDVRFANVIAVLTSTTINFIANRQWTFEGASNMRRALMLYLVLQTFDIAFTTVAIGVLVTSFAWPKMVAKLFTMGCVVSWNFILYRRVIFR